MGEFTVKTKELYNPNWKEEHIKSKLKNPDFQFYDIMKDEKF
jgi:hypothetical protein